MNTTLEHPATKRICVSCGNKFLDYSRTSPRTYCDDCRPARGARLELVSAPPDALPGEPFTVEHFRAWSSRKKLKDGSYFQLEDYQALFLDDLFARDDAGFAVFAELWLVVPEGNGKTTFIALVCLYFIEFIPEAWVPVAASARDQAVDLTYRSCSGFVERNRLQDAYRLHPGYRSIVHKQSRGALKIFASDAASGDGVDPHLAVIEELHRLASMELYETWAGKLEKSDGQLVIVSTAGVPGGAFEELREHIRRSATEVQREDCFLRAVAPGVVLHEYALPENGDPEDLELVAKANPFSRKTVQTLAKKRAKPSWRLAHWRRFTCNLPTRSISAAIMEAEWDAARTGVEIPADMSIGLGIDLGMKWDTTALVRFWLRDDEFRLLGDAVILEPPRDGSSLDPLKIEKAILDIHRVNPIHTVVMDPTHGAQLAFWIASETGATVIERAQGNALLAEDYARFMEALRNGWLWHTGDAGLRRHVLNAVTRVLPDGKARFDREKQSRSADLQDSRVIDALTAAAMVHNELCGGSHDGGLLY